MRTLLIVCWIAVAVVVGKQANPLLSLQQELRGSIQVTVKDKQTGKGIPGAEVIILPGNREEPGPHTDAEGRFAFTGVAPGDYKVPPP